MTWELIVILIVAGLACLTLELFVPGGILGTIGIVVMLSAVVVTANTYGAVSALLLLVVELIVISVGMYLWFRRFPDTAIGRAFANTVVIEDEDFRHRLDDLVGKTGRVVAPCHPVGIVEIDGQRHDVVSEGEFITNGTTVSVVRVEGTRVVVRPDQP